MVFEVQNVAVAAERWVGGPQDCSHSQFFFRKTRRTAATAKIFANARARKCRTHPLILRMHQNPYRQSLFEE